AEAGSAVVVWKNVHEEVGIGGFFEPGIVKVGLEHLAYEDAVICNAVHRPAARGGGRLLVGIHVAESPVLPHPATAGKCADAANSPYSRQPRFPLYYAEGDGGWRE